jgi:hypothetical protein
VDFARVEGRLREIASRPEALGTFTAFLPGPIAQREREQARAAFEKCAPFEPDPAEMAEVKSRKEAQRAFAPVTECYERNMPPIPLPGLNKGSKTEVLMSGRSPDGALYEFYVDQSKYGTCMSIRWPYAGGASGARGRELPSTAFGRRNPEQVFAKPYGFLSDAAEATRFRYIGGFARTNVARVKVVYLDRAGDRHEAESQLKQVTARMLDGFDSTEPFAYWMAFVPRSAGHRPIEVTAYSCSGDRLGEPCTLERP